MRSTGSGQGVVGNRWVLVGGVVYLLEWVAILAVAAAGAGEYVLRGSAVSDLLPTYRDHPDAVWFMAGWFSLVLLGRILLFIGLRQVLRDSGSDHPLLDLAVATATVSVTLEIGSYGLAAGATSVSGIGDGELVLVVDQAAVGLNLVGFGGLGVAILCSVWVMWRSGLFPVWLNVLGAASGAAIAGAGVAIAPSLQTLFDVLFVFPLLFWVWMLWAGVICWRRTPRAAAAPAA